MKWSGSYQSENWTFAIVKTSEIGYRWFNIRNSNQEVSLENVSVLDSKMISLKHKKLCLFEDDNIAKIVDKQSKLVENLGTQPL